MAPSLAENMALPAAAGGLAVCFSHPLELTKVRLQLDNELASRGTPRQYAGWIDCVAQNWRSSGVRGLQRGLSLGITREVCFNAVRIGLYEPVLGAMVGERAPSPRERMAAGFTCGALGGCCVNPIEVLKVRMQAQGGLTGHQHAIARRSRARHVLPECRNTPRESRPHHRAYCQCSRCFRS